MKGPTDYNFIKAGRESPIRGIHLRSLRRGILLVSSLLIAMVPPAAVAEIRSHTEFAPKGQRTAVWGTMCQDTFCSEGICFSITNKMNLPAAAKIAVETSLHKTDNTEATGNFCSDSKWMTYFMTITVYVEGINEDVYVTYNEGL
jgi:hypothetical protein